MKHTPITDREKRYVWRWHKTMSRQQMAENLKVDIKRIAHTEALLQIKRKSNGEVCTTGDRKGCANV